MKNNGFTLIELLSVIAVLGILALIITISTNKTINTSKTNLSKIQIQKIEEAAKLYYLTEGINDTSYDLDENKTCVNVSYLTENDYLEKSEITNPKDNSNILGSVKIIYKSNKYSYEYQDTECNHSDYFVSVDAVCDLISGNENEIGSKYQCKVKEKMEQGFENGYYFYVLSYNDKEGNITEDITKAKTLNLIMERNINSDGTPVTKAILKSDKDSNGGIYNLVAYNSSGNAAKGGPVTVMSFLNNATSTWDNIDNLNITYDDEGETFTDFALNGKARLPYHSEVNNVGCLDYEDLSCPVWMVDYLCDASPDYGTTYQENPIAYIYGYWTLSSYADSSDSAWFVSFIGRVSSDSYVDYVDSSGARPVITLGL